MAQYWRHENADVPDGEYSGEMSGHELEFEIDGEVFRCHTDLGVRGMDVPVIFQVRNNLVVEDTIHGLWDTRFKPAQ
jgi:hypothetical protein